MLVVFEGGEGVGKSSQIRLLEKALQKKGIPFIKTKEPGGTETGKKIKRILLKKAIPPLAELFLFLADRKIHIEEVIKPALFSKRMVICDRFSLSTLAYQGYGRGLNIDFLQRLNIETNDGIAPDITFLIDLPPDVALIRKNKNDRFQMEDIAFHKRVREGYLSFAKKDKTIKVIDGKKSKEEINKIVMEKLAL